MKYIVAILAVFMMTNQNTWRIDFGDNQDGEEWKSLNDGVMGGRSKGIVSFTESSLLFKGSVSLENNGGFASIRSPFQNMDLSGFSKARIRYKAVGQSFAITMESDRRWYFPYFKKAIVPSSTDWETVEFDLADFKSVRIGQPTGDKLTPQMQGKIIRLGIITNDKKSGPFEIEIDFLEFF